jgi:hypothetical protein
LAADPPERVADPDEAAADDPGEDAEAVVLAYESGLVRARD